MKKIALLVARLRALLHGLSASASVQKWLQRKMSALLGFCAIDHLQITCA
ncbi:hypothetical protein [Herbaspirillum rubrisubalbicans]|nr:hypothetical protein [Herbaspirillum rubrisubalbicans]